MAAAVFSTDKPSAHLFDGNRDQERGALGHCGTEIDADQFEVRLWVVARALEQAQTRLAKRARVVVGADYDRLGRVCSAALAPGAPRVAAIDDGLCPN